MKSKSLKNKVLHGVVWKVLEQFGAQGISFIVSIILARILGPEEFGTVALLTIFLTLSQSLVNGGFGSALIQKKNVDDLDYNSVFHFTLALSIVLYGVLWFCAPWVANFYGRPVLTAILRVSAFKVVLDAVNGVQNAILSRQMLFYLSFRITLLGIIASGVIGVSMAYAGYGVWALVWSTVLGSSVSAVARWFLIGWTPSLRFSWLRLRGLFVFGSRMLASSILNTFFVQIYGLLIGKWYSPTDLAFFNRGERFPQLATNAVQGAIGAVVFPALSQIQDDQKRLKNAMRRVMQTSSFIVFPMMFGLAVVSRDLVLILLTDKWLPCVPFMQLACISYAFRPIHVANLQTVQALGRSDIFLRLEIFKKLLIVIVLIGTFKHGVLAIAIGRVALAPLFVFINGYPCRRLICYSLYDQLWDLLPAFGLSGAMALSMCGLSWTIGSSSALLPLQIILGVAVYSGLSITFKREPALMILKQIKERLKR